MMPTLTTIPGELRNKIYEYALSDEKGLQYRETHEYREGSRRNKYQFTSREDSATEEVEGNDRGKNVENVHLQEFNQLKHVCRLLRQDTLDFELRLNTLYFHTSTVTSALARLQTGLVKIYNQCIGRGPSDCFLDFVSKPSRKPRMDLLRNITFTADKKLGSDPGHFANYIVAPPPDYFGSLVAVANICKTNPLINLSYFLPDASCTLRPGVVSQDRWLPYIILGLLRQGAMYSIILRNKDLGGVLTKDLPLHEGTARKLQNIWHHFGGATGTLENAHMHGEEECDHLHRSEDLEECNRLAVPNLRFYPSEADDYAAFLEKAKMDYDVNGHTNAWCHKPLIRNWPERFEVFEDWVKNGF